MPNEKEELARKTMKTRYHLVPPSALKQMAQVLEHGANKYGEGNYKEQPVDFDTYASAAYRHIEAMRTGEFSDPDTGLHHAAHVMANMAILIESAEDFNLHRETKWRRLTQEEEKDE